VEVDAAGAVTARRFGRTRVIAHFGTEADTAFVSVVPRGRIAAWGWTEATGPAIVLVDLDGSGLRRVVPTEGATGAYPSWSPDGRDIAFHERLGTRSS
jgi:hypothetical protein